MTRQQRDQNGGVEPRWRMIAVAVLPCVLAGCAGKQNVGLRRAGPIGHVSPPVATEGVGTAQTRFIAAKAPTAKASTATSVRNESAGRDPLISGSDSTADQGVRPAGFAELLLEADQSLAAERVTGNSGGGRGRTPEGTGDAQRFGVESFVAMALSGHPSIEAARQRVSAELCRIAKERGLPDPVFNNTFWPIHDQSLQTAAGRVANQMSLSQAIPWPEKLRAKASVVGREVQVARAEVESVELEIAESVRLAYYELWYANRALAVLDETRGLVEDLGKVAEARYRSGGTQQDVLRASLEADRLEERGISLNREKELAQADLATLLQQPAVMNPETVEELSLSDVTGQLDDLVALAGKCNPRLKGLAWEIQRDRQKQRLACLQQYPDLKVGLNWGLVSDGSDVLSPVANGHDQINFSVGTSLPLWRGKINAGIQEASHQTGNSLKRLEAERDALAGRIRRLLAQAESLQSQREIYRDRIIPRGEDTLRLAIADYRGKRADFFSLIETYRELLEFETQLARIEASLAGTLARLERAIGCGIGLGSEDVPTVPSA